MRMLRQEQLLRLARIHARPAVSIYAPTQESGAEAVGDPIQLKTGLQRSEQMLQELGADRAGIDRVLGPGRDFLTDLSPNDYGAGTLAVLLADGSAEIVHSPMQTEAAVFVSDRLHLKPLLPVFTDNAHFYVLAASQHDIRLFACTRFTQAEVPLTEVDVPQHVAEVEPPSQPRESLQYHTARPKIGAPGAGSEAVYHGQGHERGAKHHQLAHFLRDVSTGTAPFLDGHSPLVFAGVDELFAIFREANTYEHLADMNVSGNPEHLRAEELRERAWEIVEPMLDERLDATHEAFGTLAARGQASDDIKAVALAARDGRAGVMLGAVDRVVWGRVPEAGEDVQFRAEREPWDYDLIDYAAVQTMANSGSALIVPGERVPGNGRGAAALLRY